MKRFTPEEDQFLIDNHLKIPLKRISKILNRSGGSTRQRLHLLGYTVPKEIAEKFAKESRFKKGSKPINLGKKQSEFMSPEGIENSKKTRFNKGNIPHNTKYDGYERITKDGYIEVRVSKGVFKLKHRVIWEKEHGTIPDNMIIIFKDNNKQNCRIENLEMISKDENLVRNHFLPNYPRELQQVQYLNTKIKRKIDGKK